MKRLALPTLLGAGFFWVVACTDDGHVVGSRESGGSGGSSGAAASAGKGGKGGSGGTRGGAAGSGGSAAGGAAGASSGGSGGSSGSSQTAGRTGSGGDAGTTGSAGASSAEGGAPAQGGGGSGGTAGGTAGSGGQVGDAGSSGLGQACGASRQCRLVLENCCGSCGEAVLSEWIGVPEESLLEYLDGCSNTGCPACVMGEPLTFAAVCRNDQCVAVDVPKDELSACDTDDDCRLRWGTDCCECGNDGDESHLVAFSNSVNVADALCGSLLPPCCAPSAYPDTAKAVCTNHHCAVERVAP